jgi:hypothetical protein
MSIVLAPKYSVNIGSKSFDPTSSNSVETILVELSLDVPTDCVQIVLAPSEQPFGFNLGDRVDISFGYDDNPPTKIFTGEIDSVYAGSSRISVSAHSAMRILVNYFSNKIYVNQNCGQIVSDLLSSTNVSSGNVSSGIDLPVYVLDNNSSAYDHIKQLADRSGFDVYISPDGDMMFEMFTKGSPAVTAEYGVNIISVEARPTASSVQSLTLLGESPSSSRGSSSVSWLTKNLVDGTAGSGQVLVLTDPVVRDKSTASNVANARLAIAQRGPFIWVETVGDPAAMLATTLTVKSCPDSSFNGDYEIRSVEHIFGKLEGFRTMIGGCKI